MYVFSTRIEEFNQLFYVFRKSRDNPDALQRQLNSSKVADISSKGTQVGYLFPNAVIVNATEQDRMGIVEHDDLFCEVNFQVPENSDAVNQLDEPDGKIGYIIDGQHRIAGLNDHPNMKILVVMFDNLPREEAYKTFAEINQNQDKVSSILLYYIKWEIQDFARTDLTPLAFDMLQRLNEDDDSPLKENIKIFEDDRGKWVTSPTMTKLLTNIIGVDGPMQHLTEGQQLTVVKSYLTAWQEVFPEAWDLSSRKSYILTKAMGFTIMLRLFSRFYRRCDFYHNNHSKDVFKKEIQHLIDVTLPVLDGEIPLDWTSDNFGEFSSGKGINTITRLLLAIIPERGEPSIS